MAVMVNCYGQARVKGQVVERTAYSVVLKLKDGTYVSGATTLLEEPTGLPWPYEKDDSQKAFSWSWDMKVVKAFRRGLPEPVWRPWAEKKGADRTSKPANDEEQAKNDKRERARQRRLARKARGGK